MYWSTLNYAMITVKSGLTGNAHIQSFFYLFFLTFFISIFYYHLYRSWDILTQYFLLAFPKIYQLSIFNQHSQAELLPVPFFLLAQYIFLLPFILLLFSLLLLFYYFSFSLKFTLLSISYWLLSINLLLTTKLNVLLTVKLTLSSIFYWLLSSLFYQFLIDCI